MLTAQLTKQRYDVFSRINGLRITPEPMVHLSPAQIAMLQISENDIKNGNLISEEELYKQDKQWLY